MEVFFDSNSVFWFCALAGSGLFVIQFLINLVGGSGTDSGADDLKQFKWLSIQAVTGFLMIFGWSAISCQQEFNQPLLLTIGISFAFGLFAAFAIHFLVKLSQRLQSSGNVYRMEEAIGMEAYVYQRIPKGGMGKVSLSLHQLTFEMDAISDQDRDIESFSRVKVVDRAGDQTLIVTPI